MYFGYKTFKSTVIVKYGTGTIMATNSLSTKELVLPYECVSETYLQLENTLVCVLECRRLKSGKPW